MTRHADKFILAVAAVAFAVMVATQLSALWTARATVAAALDDSKRLTRQADQNNLPKRARDESAQSLRVFNAWEALPPVSQPFNVSDFYPNPTPGR